MRKFHGKYRDEEIYLRVASDEKAFSTSFQTTGNFSGGEKIKILGTEKLREPLGVRSTIKTKKKCPFVYNSNSQRFM